MTDPFYEWPPGSGRSLFYDRAGRPMTGDEYAEAKYETMEYRRIGQDIVIVGDEPCNVSTVWLGIDHNWMGRGLPIIFETMIFGGPYDQAQERYATELAAQEGHMRTVTDLAAGVAPWWMRDELSESEGDGE